MEWSKCPKDVFVHKKRVQPSVMEAVCEYNKGLDHTISYMQKSLGIYRGGVTQRLGKISQLRKNKFRLRRNNIKHKHMRQAIKKAVLKRNMLTKRKEGLTYGSGCF